MCLGGKIIQRTIQKPFRKDDAVLDELTTGHFHFQRAWQPVPRAGTDSTCCMATETSDFLQETD